MIQFNSNPLAGAGTSGSGSTPSKTADFSLDSFESELSKAISQTLEKFGINPDSVNVSIGSAAPAQKSSAKTTATAKDAGLTPFDPAITKSLAGPKTTSSASSAADTTAAASAPPPDPAQAFNDAYWAKQPAAVQALRYVADPDQRSQMAGQLASEGYTIDVPIMVWNWDAYNVTNLRHSYGYTWVPSALQNSVQCAPGIQMPGLEAYDANKPPAGSITV